MSPSPSDQTTAKPVVPDFIEELKWRGLYHQCTDEKGLREHLDLSKGPARYAYIGYDPTADSLTIGNLVTIMLLVHFQRAGHHPVVLSGGGTGLIGDPSGKSSERTLMTEERVRSNVDMQRTIFGRVFENAAKFEGREGPVAGGGLTPPIVNNIDWLGKLGFLEALRDVGKHFSVNEMIKKDSVRMRLEQRDQGISFTEFTYQILQSYDYLVLFRDHAKHGIAAPVTLQMGGSDQFGNIVGGTGLISRTYASMMLDLAEFNPDSSRFEQSAKTGQQPSRQDILNTAGDLTKSQLLPSAFGLTCPLVTKADGGKFGKTESGAVWLTGPQPDETGDQLKSRTTPYAYYQFWLNASDADVSKFLRIFTLLPRERIESIEAEHSREPGKRLAQKELAKAATRILHGEAGLKEAEGATAALFGKGGGGGGAGGEDLKSLSLEALNQAFAAAPSTQHAGSLLDGAGLALVELLPQTSLAKSKTEARTFLTDGAISVNGESIPKDAALARKLTRADLLHGQVIALRHGKKKYHVTRWA